MCTYRKKSAEWKLQHYFMKNSTITGTQNNSLSTSRTPLPFLILVSNWRKPSWADVNWLYPVLDWCKLVPRREVPEDDLTILMSVNVEKAKSHPGHKPTICRIPSRRPKIPSPSPKNLKLTTQAQHIAGTTSSGRAGHLSTTRWQTHWARLASLSLLSSSNHHRLFLFDLHS